jgi:hypothetical protein
VLDACSHKGLRRRPKALIAAAVTGPIGNSLQPVRILVLLGATGYHATSRLVGGGSGAACPIFDFGGAGRVLVRSAIASLASRSSRSLEIDLYKQEIEWYRMSTRRQACSAH